VIFFFLLLDEQVSVLDVGNEGEDNGLDGVVDFSILEDGYDVEEVLSSLADQFVRSVFLHGDANNA